MSYEKIIPGIDEIRPANVRNKEILIDKNARGLYYFEVITIYRYGGFL